MPLGALAALGGAYAASVLPLLLAAATAFLISGGAIGTAGMVALDGWLVALVAAVAVQVVPLPDALVGWLSPHAHDLQAMLSLDASAGMRPLTIDEHLTREGLESLAAAILVFWAARTTFTRGGLRIVLRSVAIGGFVIALVSIAQRATSPGLMWWTWSPIDPRARPFGPFANRNHFAAWLLMATSLTVGYAAAHMHSHRLKPRGSRRRFVRDLLVEGNTLFWFGSIVATTVTLFATTSRGAILGFVVAALAGIVLARRGDGRGQPRVVIVAILVLAVGAVWLNFEALSQRLVEGGPVSRLTIWRETLPIIRDFPATGVGIGTYAQAMLRYQQTELRVSFNYAHSEYVQVAAEGGLLVIVPVVGAACAWLLVARRRLRQEQQGLSWIRAGAAAGIAGVATHAAWESPLRMIANAMLLAVLAAVVVHDRDTRPSISTPD